MSENIVQIGPWLVACDVDKRGTLTIVVMEDLATGTKLHGFERYLSTLADFDDPSETRCNGRFGPPDDPHWLQCEHLLGHEGDHGGFGKFSKHRPADLKDEGSRDDYRRVPPLRPLLHDPNHPFRRGLERSKTMAPVSNPTPANRILNLFDQHELNPLDLELIGDKYKEFAMWVITMTPIGPEQTVCLRALLDSKHAAVRALITDDTPIKS